MITDPDNSSKNRPVFPFTAVLGQEEMKLALILATINPDIKGVLLMGDRGTAKSTIVRALRDLLPLIQVVADDPYNSDPEDRRFMSEKVRTEFDKGTILPVKWIKVPLIDLPLSVTEDRLIGTVNLKDALGKGGHVFEPGLLASANRGILYIDEVNLLGHNIVDILLDVLQACWVIIEREGLSFGHPAYIILIGSGNPEEGTVRPQFQDRFGLYVDVKSMQDAHARLEIIRRRDRFNKNPGAFLKEFASKQAQLREQIVSARALVNSVSIEPVLEFKVCQICTVFATQGSRAELIWVAAAKALAAFEGRNSVSKDDLFRVCVLSLQHRCDKNREQIEEVFDKFF